MPDPSTTATGVAGAAPAAPTAPAAQAPNPATATAPATPPPLPQKQLSPPSVLLMGPSGTGKTYSISTALAAGLEVFFLGTEPNSTDSLLDSVKRRGLPMDKLHWHQLDIPAPSWQALMDNATMVKQMSYESLSKLQQGIGKQYMQHWMEMLNSLQNFPDDRSGQTFGDVVNWADDRMLVIDSLSGMNKMAREYTVGLKPTLHQGEWGTAMQLEENIIYKLANDRHCFFTLIAHIDREVDEVQGGTKITVSALGRKLAPQLIKYFSEVVLARKEGNQFYWSTSEASTDVKNRALPINDKLLPDFTPIVRAHQERVRDILGVSND